MWLLEEEVIICLNALNYCFFINEAECLLRGTDYLNTIEVYLSPDMIQTALKVIV